MIQKNEDQYDRSDLLQQHWKNGINYIFLESPDEQEELASYLMKRESEGVKSVHLNASLNRLRRSEGEKEPVRYLAGLERRGALSLQRGASREPRKLASLRSDSAPSAASSAIIRTSEHFHVFSPPPRLSVRMFGLGGKKTRKRVLELAAL